MDRLNLFICHVWGMLLCAVEGQIGWMCLPLGFFKHRYKFLLGHFLEFILHFGKEVTELGLQFLF